MTEMLSPYSGTVICLGAIGALMIIQMLVADLIGMKNKHVPGAIVETNHKDLLFRAVRAHANTNESVAVFITLALFGMFSGANPAWLNGMAWAYLVARIWHMGFYYAGQGMLRSAAFAIGLIANIGMLIVGICAWC